MSKGHFHTAGASIDYGDATDLLPVENLDATRYRGRDAELALAAVDGSAVVIVAPTGLATSYHLTQHPLTAIRVESLSSEVRDGLDGEVDAPIDAFELLQVGKWNGERPNHSLAEFADVGQ